jgi:alanine-synthesizing transaminase
MSNPASSDSKFEINVARRVQRLPPYLFGQINAMLYNKRRAGDDVIDLGMGNPSDPPEQLVIDKLAEAAQDERNHGYSKSNGIANLRREVASKYVKQYGVRLDPENEVIVCLGSKEGFSHMCLAMMGSGDTAIVPAPYFPIHVYSVALASANVISLEVADSDKFLTDIAYTCETLYPRPKLLILNYPHNPSTVVIDQAFYDEVVKLAKRYGFMVISDFAYADVAYDGYKPPSFLASEGASEVGVEFTTMSKGYNMAGWRIGYCCGNAQMISALATIKGYYDYGMFQAIQIAAIVALRHTDAAVEKQSQIYQGRRDALCQSLSQAGWQITPPQAGMFLWVPIPEVWRQRMSTMDFAMMLLEKGNVAVSPGSGFGPAGDGFLRMSLVENEARLRQAARQINRCLREAE